GHGDDEIFTDAQAIAWFDVRDVVRAPARLDWRKLAHVNNHYIRRAGNVRLARLVTPILESRNIDLAADFERRLIAAIPAVKDGAKTVRDLADLTLFAIKQRPLDLDEKGLALLTDDTRALLSRLATSLSSLGDWTTEAVTEALRAFAVAEGVGLSRFGAALRATLSGGASAPDLAGALTALGKAESLGRMDDALSRSRQGFIRPGETSA
ncbi:MAG: glutamate--tRNA ligase, partial [Pseudomonadota bacterium]|nr:glutamate--tRNA ligase [Pseudomonadota bacterium]